jgi:hypothetical protein
MIPWLLNSAWQSSCRGAARRFQLALENPRQAQQRILQDVLAQNQATRFGRLYGFKRIRSPQDYRGRVPLQTYDSLAAMIDAAARGEKAVLTQQPVTRLLPSSGSSAARKLIPYTCAFQRQLDQAISPWIHNLLQQRPEVKSGRAFWSVSPKFSKAKTEDYSIPVGFDHDSAYLNRWARPMAERLMAMPSWLNRIDDIDEFRYQQLLHLLACADLSLVSIWHPAYLTLLLNELPNYWSALLKDLHKQKKYRRRVAWLEKIDHRSYEKIWPRLRLISCWGSAHALAALGELKATFPNTEFQEKGLLATEAVVSIPFIEQNAVESQKLLAVNSHFFEFLCDDGSVKLADELREGESYRVVVTTGGGLYRYQLQDRIVVTGKIKQTPCIEFVGKEDSISDYCGEKLADSFVARKLKCLLTQQGLQSVFTMLAPDDFDGDLGYTLYIQANERIDVDLASRLDDSLSENPHYELCRRLGQLSAPRVFEISTASEQSFIDSRMQQGCRLGDIKPVSLSNRLGWSQRFEGSYL